MKSRKKHLFSFAVLFFAALLIVFSEVWHPLLHHSREHVAVHGISEASQEISGEICDQLCPVCAGQFRFAETSSQDYSLSYAVSAEKIFPGGICHLPELSHEDQPRAPPASF